MTSFKRLTLILVSATLFQTAAQAEFVTCESNSNDRNSCNVDTRDGVRLIRQESKSDCIEGQTWGYDDRGIWVRGGCRAVFEVRGENRNRRSGYDYNEPEYNQRPQYNPPSPHYNPPARRAETCPAGFSPSEQKCSQDERRRGCKDIRMDGGLGCVKR